jgi:hypothetical protein
MSCYSYLASEETDTTPGGDTMASNYPDDYGMWAHTAPFNQPDASEYDEPNCKCVYCKESFLSDDWQANVCPECIASMCTICSDAIDTDASGVCTICRKDLDAQALDIEQAAWSLEEWDNACQRGIESAKQVYIA